MFVVHLAVARGGRRVALAATLALCVAFGGSREALAQAATLSGRVLDNASGRPIASAEAAIQGSAISARADSTGVFRLRGVPAGTHQIVVRAIGFEPATQTFQVAANDSIALEFLLTIGAVPLAEVRVEAATPERYATRLKEFDERRTKGIGRFLDWRFFEINDGRHVGVLLASQIPGLRFYSRNGRDILMSDRYGKRCEPQTVVNGMIVEGIDLAFLRTNELIGFEYYTAGNAPLKYTVTGNPSGGAQCGTAVFWMK